MAKFLLTKELGRLAKWLRILGFDARYEPSANKSYCMIEALKEERVLVTKNLRYGRRHGGTIVFIRHDNLKDQLGDFLGSLRLKVDPKNLFSRCVVCNQDLLAVEKAAIQGCVPAYVYQTHEEFMRCAKCDRVYWKGTHWGNVEEILGKL